MAALVTFIDILQRVLDDIAVFVQNGLLDRQYLEVFHAGWLLILRRLTVLDTALLAY